MSINNTKNSYCIITISSNKEPYFYPAKIIDRGTKSFRYHLYNISSTEKIEIHPRISGHYSSHKEFFLVFVPKLEIYLSLCFKESQFLPDLSGSIDAEELVVDGYELSSLTSSINPTYQTENYFYMTKPDLNTLLSKIYNYIFNDIDELSETIPLSDLPIDFGSFDPDGVKDLIAQIEDIIEGSQEKKKLTKPDPIAALLMSIDKPGETLTEEEYEQFEQARIADKWRGNRIGSLNEAILNIFPNIKLSEAGKLDIIVNDEGGNTVAIAEVKNRYNTMNAASAIRTRHAMETLVLDRGASYHNADAILVERIPKSDGKEVKFNPSNPARGTQGTDTDKIKRMGMQQFFTKYCGDKFAYIKAVIFIAQVLRGKNIIKDDFDMKFIFKLLKRSVS